METSAPLASGRGGGLCEVEDCAAVSRYECPRCAVAYCTVECYKRHSGICVEAFRADAAEDRRGVRATGKERKRMREILQRLIAADAHAPDGRERPDLEALSDDSYEHSDDDDLDQMLEDLDVGSDGGGSGSEDSGFICGREEAAGGEHEDDEEGDDDDHVSDDDHDSADAEADALEELLVDMNTMGLSYEEALKRLPPTLAKDFSERVGDGRIARLVKLWRPWWLVSAAGDGDASDGDSEDDDEDDRTMGLDGGRINSRPPPAVITADLPLSPSSACTRASPALLYSVFDVVASYCLAMRLCNGDWEVSASDTASLLYQNSSVLSKDARHGSVAEAAMSLLARAGPGAADAAAEAVADCAAVLRWGGAVAAGSVEGGAARALQEVSAIIRAGGDGKRRANRVERKVGFFCAWASGATVAELSKAASKATTWVAAQRKLKAEIVAEANVREAQKGQKRNKETGAALSRFDFLSSAPRAVLSV
jgi:hypothetical protein